jgi:adenosylcobinamide-phosphate synthase
MISITSWTNNFAIAGLAIASFLDYLIGDPWNWLHPVQVIGWMISRYTHFALKLLKHPLSLRIAGVILGLGMIGGSGLAGWLIVQAASFVHWSVAIAISSILLASCFAGRSLRAAAEDVFQPLNTGDIATARSKLRLYVGRDTAQLTEPEILRAVFETVTENATDGVMAPLFWAIAGAFTPIGSVPFALAYKAASTLDSMVGYREAPYTHLGWFSARLEDYLTWIPCRLTVLSLSLLSGKPKYVWQICCRDAPQDPSPNAGWSECAYAAVVGVQVGGMNIYKGVVKHKPLLGNPIHPITPARIEQAMGLTRSMFLIWVAIAILTLWLI